MVNFTGFENNYEKFERFVEKYKEVTGSPMSYQYEKGGKS